MIRQYFVTLPGAAVKGWNRFWFTPMDSAHLTVIRIATGWLLFYSHVIWAWNSGSFFGEHAWLNEETISAIQSGGYAWSPLWLIDGSPVLIQLLHGAALLNAMLLTVGLWSRPAAIIGFLLTAFFANRNPAALYGFDQVLGFLTLYLSVHPGNDCLSLDAWRRSRRGNPAGVRACLSVSANIATRLIQLHLCLIYLVAGLSKLKGAGWWSGVAFWGAIANYEYQTIDMTWLVDWPMVINLLTLSALAWEISYPALVWNRWLRPLVITYAVLLHAGIALCFGMITFGTAMIVANLAFVSPLLVRSLVVRHRVDPWLAAIDRSSRNNAAGGSSVVMDLPQSAGQPQH